MKLDLTNYDEKIIKLENADKTIVGTEMLYSTFESTVRCFCTERNITELSYELTVKSDKRDINVFVDGKKCFGITTCHMGKAYKLFGNDKNKDTEELYHMDRVRAKSLANGDIASAGNGKNSVHVSMMSVVKEMFHLIDVYLCIIAYKKDASAFIESAKAEMTEALGETTAEAKEETTAEQTEAKKTTAKKQTSKKTSKK